MKLLLQLRLMYLAISKEKGRMVLVVLVVAIGQSCVMTLVALSKGAEKQVAQSLQKAGYNLLTVSPATLKSLPGRGGQWYTARTLSEKDVSDITHQITDVRVVEPVIERSFNIKFADRDVRTSVKGVSGAYQALRNLQLQRGRFLTLTDVQQKAKVAVVGSFIANKLNDGHNLIGQKILINRAAFTVVGELAEKGLSSAGNNLDDLVLVPFDSATVSLMNKDYIDRMLIQYKDNTDVDGVIADISDLLRSNHHISLNEEDDFDVLQQNQSDAAQATAESLISGLAAFFTVVTLVVGGIGVLTVSYLNILDRKAEIGLRMALGATPGSIAFMVMVEAILLCVFGGILGMVTGMLIIGIFKLVTQWHLQIDVMVVILPFVISAGTGVISGVIPARMASKIVPAQTLN